MGPAVVVDVPPVQAAAAERALATCNAALGPNACTLSGDGANAHFYAVVRFDPEHQAVLSIELYDGNATGPRIASTQLEFKDRDTELERWASAGVVVAALVAAQTAGATESTPTPKPVPAPPPSRAAAPRVRARPRSETTRALWARLDLGATGGSELANGTLRFGPLARFGLAFERVPLFVLGSGSYTVRGAGTPDLTWVTGSAGVGADVGFAQHRLALELRAEAVLESVSIHASDGSRAENASRTRAGARFGLDFSGYFAKNLGLVAGLEAAVLRPRVDIDVEGADQSGLPPFNWGFISAVRYDFR